MHGGKLKERTGKVKLDGMIADSFQVIAGDQIKTKSKLKKKTGETTEDWEIKPVRALAPGRKTYRRGSLRRALRRTRTPAAAQTLWAKNPTDTYDLPSSS